MDTEIQKRKSPRLRDFDYSSSRYYFVTICTDGQRHLFGTVTETKEGFEMQMSPCGKIVQKHVLSIEEHYATVKVSNYVIMPNHLHMIILLDNGSDVPITQIIGLFKSGVSKEIGFSVWQRSFHDHIIRNEDDFKNIWNYIDNNPAKWVMDKYYC